jgi:hypothetical protein
MRCVLVKQERAEAGFMNPYSESSATREQLNARASFVYVDALVNHSRSVPREVRSWAHFGAWRTACRSVAPGQKEGASQT